MITDRGLIKCNSIMLPEHVDFLKDSELDVNKAEMPTIDEQTTEKFEMIIMEAMEFNSTLEFQIFENGLYNSIQGTIHYINHIKSQIILQDKDGYFYHIPLKKLVKIQLM
ncbi:YolD-like family protein [Bacillaceae bacterium CLA-AA-H227]|uniref:YolD-like family protein n=1 Tax=Robertmurraya yapensis (ex Hitch et al 2024) TaxID=3133160 RepID=A0ACC6SGE7_9BACI